MAAALPLLGLGRTRRAKRSSIRQEEARRASSFPLSVAVGRAKSARMDKPADIPAPPTAEQRPFSYERHGVTIEDPWHWLRDPKYPAVDDPDVLAYLHAENDYFQGWKKQHQPLTDALFEEMKGRIK